MDPQLYWRARDQPRIAVQYPKKKRSHVLATDETTRRRRIIKSRSRFIKKFTFA